MANFSRNLWVKISKMPGHTFTSDNNVKPKYDGRFILTDTSIWHPEDGKITAVMIQPDGSWKQLDNFKRSNYDHRLRKLFHLDPETMISSWRMQQCLQGN
jgi:hypothetical protein